MKLTQNTRDNQFFNNTNTALFNSRLQRQASGFGIGFMTHQLAQGHDAFNPNKVAHHAKYSHKLQSKAIIDSTRKLIQKLKGIKMIRFPVAKIQSIAQQMQTKKALSVLSDKHLADIGISRQDLDNPGFNVKTFNQIRGNELNHQVKRKTHLVLAMNNDNRSQCASVESVTGIDRAA